MRILITGINGFVGRHLVDALSAGHTLYGLSTRPGDIPDVEAVYGWDRLDSLPDVDAVIHLAAIAHDLKGRVDTQAYFDVNVGLTRRIYDLFLKSSATKFVFFSSVKAAADSVPSDAMLTEDAEPVPAGPYGESKLEAERYILSHPADGRLVTILRPAMIHGPGNKGNLNLLHSLVRKGVPWPLGAFDNRRSFASVENVKFAVKSIIESDTDSGIYNVCDDEALSTNDLIAEICAATGRKSRIVRVWPGLVRFAARAGDMLGLPLNSERLAKLTENYTVSNGKLKGALGIDAMPVGARDGVYSTIVHLESQSAKS